MKVRQLRPVQLVQLVQEEDQAKEEVEEARRPNVLKDPGMPTELEHTSPSGAGAADAWR